MKLTNLIKDGIARVQDGLLACEKVYHNEDYVAKRNEFLFFMKPELTCSSGQIDFEGTMDLIETCLASFGMEIKDITVLSSKYLKAYDIMGQHYGVINKLANDPSQMSDRAKKKFKEVFGEDFEGANVIGGIPFLKKYPALNPLSIDFMWQNIAGEKLAGGTYCAPIKIDGVLHYVVNGFFPRQLIHYTAEGRCIVVCTVTGDLDWATARQRLIGATNPSKAVEGSIRRMLFDRQKELGLAEISQGVNGVHLSAGPIEGLVELLRFNTDYASNQQHKVSLSDFAFGQGLLENFERGDIERFLANENVVYQGKKVSFFDLTEEKNAGEAIKLLKKVV